MEKNGRSNPGDFNYDHNEKKIQCHCRRNSADPSTRVFSILIRTNGNTVYKINQENMFYLSKFFSGTAVEKQIWFSNYLVKTTDNF